MKAMAINAIGPVTNASLKLTELRVPEPQGRQILLRVTACGVCHTELDQIEGRLACAARVVPGHEIVGKVESCGPNANRYNVGDRVGIGWINSACGRCEFCRAGTENLCSEFRATGCHANGGYAEYTLVSEDYACSIPDGFEDGRAAPLLCAGAIGYRALKLTGIEDGEVLGLFGFGASAHIAIQIVRYTHRNCKVFVFTRAGQIEHQRLATELGADWVGETGQEPPEALHRAIDFTPAWRPVVEAMGALTSGGRLVINAIRKEPADKEALLRLDYARHLWMERELKSVANITRADLREFLPLAAAIGIRPRVQEFRLDQANQALVLLKQGKIEGAAVLNMRLQGEQQ